MRQARQLVHSARVCFSLVGVCPRFSSRLQWPFLHRSSGTSSPTARHFSSALCRHRDIVTAKQNIEPHLLFNFPNSMLMVLLRSSAPLSQLVFSNKGGFGYRAGRIQCDWHGGEPIRTAQSAASAAGRQRRRLGASGASSRR
jgi:hypothetical protein